MRTSHWIVVGGLLLGALGPAHTRALADRADREPAAPHGGESPPTSPSPLRGDTAIRAALLRERYAFRAFGDGTCSAANMAFGFGAEVSRRGMTLEEIRPPRGLAADARAPWRVQLDFLGIGRGARIDATPTHSRRVRRDQVVFGEGDVSVHYGNGPTGLQQDFCVGGRPEGTGPLRLAFGVDTSLGVRVAPDAVAFVGDDGAPRLRYHELRVVDAEMRDVPSRFVAAEGGFGIEVEDTGATYPLWVDPCADTDSWSEGSNDIFTCVGAGDVNGDGYGDVVAADPYFVIDPIGRPPYTAGRVYVFHGSVDGLTDTPDWGHSPDTFTPSNPVTTQFNTGLELACAGDVNGDGFSDILVGRLQLDQFGDDERDVLLFVGSSDGMGDPDRDPDWVELSQGSNSSHFGEGCICSAGDLDNDGKSDFVIGAPYHVISGEIVGRIYVYKGRSPVSGVTHGGDQTRDPLTTTGLFGFSVAYAGDVNGDNKSDLIVGAPAAGLTGKAFVYHGTTSGNLLGSSPATEITGAVTGSLFGASVGGGGDVDGDGFCDVVIGAPATGSSEPGRVYVHRGTSSGIDETPTDTLLLTYAAGAQFGLSVSLQGDSDGDGLADVVARASTAGGFTGGVFQWRGRSEGLSSTTYDACGSAIGAPSYADANGDGLSDILVSGGVEYRGVAPGLSLTAEWTVDPANQLSAYFGEEVAAIGDVNGDGFTDFAVGCPRWDNGSAVDAGRVYVFHGGNDGDNTPPGPDSTADLVLTPLSTDHALFGKSIAGGDVNGDGYSDLLVCAPGKPKVFLYLGSSAGLSSSSSWSSTTGAACVAYADDVNQDGFGDVLVGYPDFQASTTGGKVLVYHGQTGNGGLPNSASASLTVNLANAQFGARVAGGGDADADGFSDALVGAPGVSSGGNGAAGRAYLFRGSSSGLGSSAAKSWDGTHASENYGTTVRFVGDVNRDGYSDWAVGAERYGTTYPLEGHVDVFHGNSTSNLPSTANWSGDPTEENAAFYGMCIGRLGDVNGDGYDDVAIAAEDQRTTFEVYVHYGSSSGLSGEFAPNRQLQFSGNTGIGSVAGLDANGDGSSDLLVGTCGYTSATHFLEGRAGILWGGGVRGLDIRRREYRGDLSARVHPPLSSKHASKAYFGLFCRTFAGRQSAEALFEVQPFGTAFATSMGISSLLHSSFDDTGTGGVNITAQKTGLASGTGYCWRARYHLDPSKGALQPCGRWLWHPQNGLREVDFRTQ